MGKYRKKLFASGALIALILPSLAGASLLQVPGAGITTISEAMIRAKSGDTIRVEDGTYREHVMMVPGVTLISRNLFKAVIDGKARGTCVTLAKNSCISGFEITNGTIGVFSNQSGSTISSCRIVNNWQTGIIVVRHLAKIEDNVIAFNRGSGIQGWDVRSTSTSINHNSIAFNGNHGVALGGASEIVMENNVIAFNERFGLKILQESERVQVSNNDFYRNLMSTKPLPSGNFEFDPAFIAPRTHLNFKSDPKLCCKAKGTDNLELGARLTY